MTARRFGHALIIAAMTCCGGCDETTSVDSGGDGGGGGRAQVTGWFSDWATQTADLGHDATFPNQPLLDRLVDRVSGVNKWNDGASRLLHGEIVTAPAAAPFAKWWEIEHQSTTHGGTHYVSKTNVPIPAVGEILTYGWSMSYDLSSTARASNDNHGIEAGAGSPNWEFIDNYWTPNNTEWSFFFIFDNNAFPNRDWGIWPGSGRDDRIGNANSTNQARLLKNHVYEFQLQIHRLSANTYNAYIWVWDAETRPRTLLYDTDDFWNANASVNLGSKPTLSFVNINTLNNLVMGSNGGTGSSFTTPLPHKRIGAVRVVLNQTTAGTPIDPYGSVIGEVPR